MMHESEIEITAIALAIETLVKRQSHELADLHDSLLSAYAGWEPVVSEDEKNALLSIIYLDVPSLDVSRVEAATGLKWQGIRKRIKGKERTVQCLSCGKDVTVEMKSRTGECRTWGICAECSKPRKEPLREARQFAHVDKKPKRDTEITKLKTMPYDEYLKTDHWQRIRKQALQRAHFRCELDNKNGTLHVHHKTYERRGEERPWDLIVLCEECHRKFHGLDE